MTRKYKKNPSLLILIVLTTACVDRITIKIPVLPPAIFTVDGLITDEPGPYTVKLTSAIRLDGGLTRGGEAISVKKITLYDDIGNEEILSEITQGTYQTKPDGIRGKIGREYHIRIEANDGTIYESLPDKMNPVGAVDTIYHRFVSFQPENAPTEYGYRISIDAHDRVGNEIYTRWKVTGTYVIETLPEYTVCLPNTKPCSYCPPSCSGVAGGTKCTCCKCWVTEYEDKPHLNTNQFVKNGKYREVEMGFVPINFYTLFEKYRVEVTQMSLSRFASEFWGAIQVQKESSNSLFQPISGKIPTNFFDVKGQNEITGIFYASAVTKKQIYISSNENRAYRLIRLPIDCAGREGAKGKDCRLAFPFSSTTPPADWK